jgi:hypothetical protein
MHVRFATHDDIPALVRLRLDFFDDDPHMAVAGDRRARIAAQLESYYDAPDLDFFAALAETDGSIAAVSFLIIHEKPANYRFPTGKTGEIQTSLHN